MLTTQQINQARKSAGFQPLTAPGVVPTQSKPLSERMGWTQTPQQAENNASDTSSAEQYGSSFPATTGESVGSAGLKALGNVPSSTLNLGKNLYNAVRHPIDTISGVGEAGLGAMQAGLKATTGIDIGNEKAKDAFDSLSKNTKDRYGSFENLQRTATNDPSGFGLDVLSVLTGGAGTVGKASEVGELVSQSGKILTKPVSEVVSGTGRLLKKLGEKSYSLVISPDMKEAEQILAHRAEHPLYERVLGTITGKENPPVTTTRTATEQGLIGTKTSVGVQARRQADNLWKNVITPAVEKSKAIISQEEMFSPIEKRISNTLEPAKRQAYMDAYDAIKEDYKAAPQFMNLKDAQNVKRGLDEFTPEKLFRGKNVANEYKVLQNDMANAIRSKTYDVIPDINAKKAYLDYGNLIELQKIGTRALAETGLQGGSGKLIGSLYKSAVTPVATIGGQTLYKAGDLFEFLGKPGLTTVGDYLGTLGYMSADALSKDLGFEPSNEDTDTR